MNRRLALVSLLLCGILGVALPEAAVADDAKKEALKAAKKAAQTNAFNTVFQENAVGRSDVNAYLLTYLVTLVFPENLDRLAGSSKGGGIDTGYVLNLHRYPDRFLAEYRKLTEYLFYDPAERVSTTNPRPQYAFIRGSGAPRLKGYDPEALVIATPKAVIVVLRGTDVVADPIGPGSNLPEWIHSDIFKFIGITPDVPGLAGKIHEGFWYSVVAPTVFWGESQPDGSVRTYQVRGAAPKDNEFRERVYQQIVRFGGGAKKVWLVGHSLGAAQAQIMAAWLDARVNTQGQRQGVTVQGAYAVAAPHVGNREFVEVLNARFTRPGQRLQRFEFVDDPVTLLPPYAIGYQRAGTRVYYDDIKTIQFGVPERFITDDAKIGPAVSGALTDASVGWMTDGNKFVKLRAAASVFCFHHPQWYLNAAYAALSRNERTRVPPPLAVPDLSDFSRPCGPLDVARGRRSPQGMIADAAKEGGAVVQDAIDTVVYNASQLLANATGTAIDEGTYFIRAVKGGKYLDVSGSCVGENGCKVQLWDLGQSESNNKFTVKKHGLGYLIRSGGGRYVEVDANDLLDNNARVQIWEPNVQIPLTPPGHAPNQVWRFYKVKNNRYLIVNEASNKVIDAKDDCTSQNGCLVRQYTARDNDPSQVWIVEKAK